VSAHFRIYYFNQLKPDDTRLEALAGGGWIKYQSGWLLDTFAMGASFFGSAPLYAPADTDGTLLLKTGQKGYYVRVKRGARCAIRTTRCSRATVSWSTRRISTRRTTG